jgi:hypothetical protein
MGACASLFKKEVKRDLKGICVRVKTFKFPTAWQGRFINCRLKSLARPHVFYVKDCKLRRCKGCLWKSSVLCEGLCEPQALEHKIIIVVDLK